MLDMLTIQEILTVLCGAAGFVASGFVLYVIFKFKDLHFNAFYLAAALAATDMINSVANIGYGSYVLDFLSRNESHVLIPKWQCVFVPTAGLFAVAYHSGSMMILLIACDRLLAMAAVKFYYSLGNKYTIGLITFCALYTMGVYSYFAYDMLIRIPQNATSTKFCFSDIYSESVHLYNSYSTASFVTIAVLIMMVTMIILHKRAKSSIQSSAEARNIKATKLLALISLNTFLMWVVPDMIVAAIIKYAWFLNYGQFLWRLQTLHAVTNLVIYFRKGSQMRQAFTASTHVQPI